MNTPAHSQHERHDILSPLHFSGVTPSSFTPSYKEDVDFTPIRTPWRLDNRNDTISVREQIETSVTTEKTNSDFSNDNIKNKLLFTPSERSPNLSASKNTTSKSICREDNKLPSDLQLFLDNNKAILTPHLVDNQHLTSPSNNDHTPTPIVKTNNNITTPLMTFITPFKDPFSPRESNDDSNDEDVTPMNISAEQVDSFIDEVISNTSKHATPSKTLYSAHLDKFSLELNFAIS